VRRRRMWPIGVATAAMAIAIVGGAWWWIAHRAAPADAIDSLLVLPLENDTGDPQAAYAADAITDGIIRALSALPNLKVIGRQTAFQFRGKNLTPQQIHDAVPVRAVMSGRLRRAGDEFAIEAEVSDTRDGSVIISRQYLEPAASAARIEVDITSNLVRDLRVTISEPAAARLAKVSTTNGQAYQLHLRARALQDLQTPDGFHQALALNKQAVGIDPNFAEAWIDQAQEAFELGTYFEAARDWMPQAKIASLEALRVDPTATDPHIVLGLVALIYDWDMAAAERELVTTAGLSPATVSLFSCSVHLLQNMNKRGLADDQLVRALAVDPLSAALRSEVGCNAYYERKYDTAVKGSLDTLELDPGDVVAIWNLTRAYDQIGKYDDAIAALNRARDPLPILVAERGYVLAKQGKAAEAKRTLDALARMRPAVYVDPYLEAEVYAGLGDGAHVVASLEAAYRDRSGLLASLSGEPKWDAFRTLPGFADVQKRIGF